MKRSIPTAWNKLWVGLLLTFALAVALWASIAGGGPSFFAPRNTFVCFFSNVSGLLPGAPVWMAGIEVGSVKEIRFVNLDSLRQVRVTVSVVEDYWPMITSESGVSLGTIGFLGDKFVEVTPRVGPGGTPINSGDTLFTIDAGSANRVFKEAEASLETAGSILNGVDTLLTRMNRGDGTLGRMAVDSTLYVEMTRLLVRLTGLTADLQRNQERVIGSIEEMSQSVSDLTGQVAESQGTLGRMLNDPSLYDNLAASTAKLDTILLKLNNAEGSLGLMVSDTGLYVETVNTLTRLGNILEEIEKNPKDYFNFSIF